MIGAVPIAVFEAGAIAGAIDGGGQAAGIVMLEAESGSVATLDFTEQIAIAVGELFGRAVGVTDVREVIGFVVLERKDGAAVAVQMRKATAGIVSEAGRRACGIGDARCLPVLVAGDLQERPRGVLIAETKPWSSNEYVVGEPLGGLISTRPAEGLETAAKSDPSNVAAKARVNL